MSGLRGRLLILAAVAAFMVGGIIGWAAVADPVVAPAPAGPTVLPTGPGLLFRDTDTGRLAADTPDGSRRAFAVECVRAAAAAGIVACLAPNAWGQFELRTYDRQLHLLDAVPLNGIPSRVRMSADGRLVGFSTFVSGDSYAASSFSTRAGIIDRATGIVVSTLEDFTVDGHRPAADANFWGVTFATDDRTIYATMATGRHHWLVRGDLAARTFTTVAAGIECPSLSPDGQTIAYKQRLADHTWQPWTYRLDNHTRTRLAELATVDDQLLWLDDHTVAYARPGPDGRTMSVWSLPADGTGVPVQLADHAESPTILGA